MPSCVVPCVELLRALSRRQMAALAAVAIGTAGCSSESTRFNENPYTGKPGEVTGSVPPARGAPVSRVETTALPPPAPGRPGTVGVAPGAGTAGGGRGLGSYSPGGAAAGGDVTGSIHTAPAAPAAPHWSWDGGTAITVAAGDTVDSIARRHGVPAAAVVQANNLTSANAIYPGQRLVIPRYGAAGAAPAAPPVAARPPAVAAPKAAAPATPLAASGTVHVVAPGDTLSKISRTYGKPLGDIAKANNIPPHQKLNIGDRITIPGARVTLRKEEPKLAVTKPLGAPTAPKAPAAAPKGGVAAKDGAEETAAIIAPVAPPAAAPPAGAAPKGGEAGAPSFRWPVRGRVIAGYGPRVNGQQNDGINIALPEGTPIKAAEDGVVAYAGSELRGYGNLVLIRHSNGYVTAYAHAQELMVKRGDTIKRGQVIAKSGQTGNVDGPQLHFEIRKGPTPVDPVPLLAGG